jgi:helicase MOV-10
MNYKFVLATCSMAGKLYNLGIELEHFDIIIIDEAGEATEPEALAAFSSLISKEG